MLARNPLRVIILFGILVSPSLSFSLESNQTDSQFLSEILQEASQGEIEQEIMDTIAEYVEEADKLTLATTESSKKDDGSNSVDEEKKTFLENLRTQVDLAMKDPDAFITKPETSKKKETIELAKAIEEKPKTEKKKTSQTSEKRGESKEIQTAAVTTAVTGGSAAAKGWVYIGQFHNEKWNDKALKVGDELPKVGENYLVNLSSHIRKALPIKRKLADVVKILNVRDRVKVLNIHRLGRNGHYWALVESLVGR